MNYIFIENRKTFLLQVDKTNGYNVYTKNCKQYTMYTQKNLRTIKQYSFNKKQQRIKHLTIGLWSGCAIIYPLFVTKKA